jgi:NDP-sugar pyrophosphorylase family protein
MLPLLGKPLIARIMDSFYRAGIRRFTVVVGENEGSVAAWLSSKWYPDVRLTFAPQGHQRGTASTLFAARKFIDGPFVIVSCDNLISEEHAVQICTYFETHARDVAVLSLFYAPDEIGQGAGVLLDPRGHVMYISEQPTGAHQDYMTVLSVYGFTPTVLEYLDRVPLMDQSGERVLATAIQMMIDDQHTVGAVEASHRVRLETPDDLRKANMRLLAELKTPSLLSEIPSSVRVFPPVHVDPGVIVGKDAVLGPNVYIESGSIIGAGASLRDTLILGVRISAGQQIAAEIVYEDR